MKKKSGKVKLSFEKNIIVSTTATASAVIIRVNSLYKKYRNQKNNIPCVCVVHPPKKCYQILHVGVKFCKKKCPGIKVWQFFFREIPCCQNDTKEWGRSEKKTKDCDQQHLKTTVIKMKIPDVFFCVLLLFLGTCDADRGVSSSHPDCGFDADSGALTCQLRTLNGANQTSLQLSGGSSSTSKRIREIRISCSDVFFYESFLRTNHFGYLAGLRTLGLEYCKIRRLPALGFSGLSGLRDLEVIINLLKRKV